MELLFLGTSSGTPTKTRNVSALAIRSEGARHWYLVDCGEATQHRILHTRLSLTGLRAVFITHMHGDHCYGLPGLLASAGMLNRTEPLLIMGPGALQRFIAGVMETTQLRLPYALEFVEVEDLAPLSRLPDLAVQPVALSHRLPSYAYSFTEKSVENRLDVARLEREGVARGPHWGLLQQGGEVTLADGRVLRGADYLLPARRPRKLVVGGDNDTPALLRDAVRDADVLVHEATYTEDMLARVGPGPQHSSAARVARFAAEAGIAGLVLTHFSPRYQGRERGERNGGLSVADIADEARRFYPGRLFLANDLDRFILDREGHLATDPPGP